MDKSKKKYTKKVVDKFYPSFCRIQVYRNQKKQILKISVKEIIMDIGYKGYSSTQEFPVNRELNKKFFEFYKNEERLAVMYKSAEASYVGRLDDVPDDLALV